MENSHDPYAAYQPHPQPEHAHHHAAAATPPQSKANTRGIEYVFLTIALLTAAASLIVVLIVWINGLMGGGSVNFSSLAFPAASLVIALPVLAVLLIDLEKAELKNPALVSDPYKVRSAQFVKAVAFTTCFFTLISLVYGIFTNVADNSGSLARLLVDVFVILVVAGGILAYYIVNERHS